MSRPVTDEPGTAAQPAPAALIEARRAHAERNWPEAFDLFNSVAVEELSADDLAALAETAWWLGRLDDSAAARERAYEARAADGDGGGAALEAFYLSLAMGDKGEDALASGWRSRAARLAEDEPDGLAAGYLLSMEAVGAFHAGDADGCVEKAARTIEIGHRNGDATLEAWAIHVEGLGLIKRGDVERGWARLDESMLALTTSGAKPMWAGLMHCGMLVACEEFGDPRRGWQWVQTTERWMGTVPGGVLYPGVCRVHKVRIMQMRGTWADAEAEAHRACDDLMRVHVYSAARGFYEIAEIKRLRGDFEAAHDLYKKAHGLGFDPQPGLARLRVAQGRVPEAVAGLRRLLGETQDPLLRAHLLPHQVDVALEADEMQTAISSAEELRELAARYRSPAISATAATACGAVALARGESSVALAELRRATTAWRRLDCLYELARARRLAAEALRSLGDDDGATLELEAALEIFERLGAAPDVRHVEGMLGAKDDAGGLSRREIEVLRLVAAGHSNKEIAAVLFISENTVARHMQNIFTKLDVGSRTAATAVAHKRGLA